MNNLQKLLFITEQNIASCTAASVIGYRVLEAEYGRVVVGLDQTEHLHNPMGTLHGGVISIIADAAMGYAFSTTLAEDELFTTVELKVNFLKAVKNGAVRAESKIIKPGSKISLLECYVTDEAGNLIAHATCLSTILKKKNDGTIRK